MMLHDPKMYTATIVSAPKTYKLQPDRELQEFLCAPIDEYAFNEKIRDPASGKGVVEAADWGGDSGYTEGGQRDAYVQDEKQVESENKK